MEIFINDVSVSCPDKSTLQEILQQQSVTPVNIAIAIDSTVIPKSQWDTTVVNDGNHILIIKAVQGG